MLFPETPRVIYQKNPLVEVICQLRFPLLLRIDTEMPVDFQEALREEYPKLKVEKSLGINISVEGNIDAQGPTGLKYEFASEEDDPIWKVVLANKFLALTTQKYERWEEFRGRLERLITTLAEIYRLNFFTRIGLRYQDLIVRSELDLKDCSWTDLLKPHIAGQFSPSGLSEQDLLESLSVFRCPLSPLDGFVRVRHGLDSRNDHDAGEFAYLIDSDFYTDIQTKASDALTILDNFNRQAGRLFRWCIQERLHEAMDPQHVNTSRD